MSTTTKSLNGFFWLTGGAGLHFLLRALFVAVLSRLLSPEDFGLLSTAMLVISLTELFVQIGIGPALIQRTKITKNHISTSITFSIFAGIALYLLFLTLNGFIEEFFRMPGLKGILNWLCLIFPLHLFSQISYSLLQKEMKFKILAGWDSLSYLIGYGFVGVTLALYGFGVYSLVIASLIQALLYSIFLYRTSNYKIDFAFKKQEFRELISVGGGFTLANILNYFARNGDYIIIGRYMGSVELGVYSRSYTLMNMADSLFGNVINKVMFPIFSNIQEDQPKVKIGLLRSLELLLILLIPTAIFLFLNSKSIVLGFLGAQWVEAIFPFQILIIGMVPKMATKLFGVTLKGIGKIKANTYFQLFYMISIVSLSYYFRNETIVIISYAVSATLFLNFFLQIIYLLYINLLNLTDLLKTVSITIPLSLLTIISTIVFNRIYQELFQPNDFLSMTLSVITLGIIISLIIYFELKLFLGAEGVHIIKKIKNKVNKNEK